MKSSFEDPQISKDFIIVNQLFPPSFNLGRVSCNILSSSPVSLKLYNFHMVPRYLFGHETCNTINQISTLGKDHFECDGRIICRPTKELVSILLVDRDYYWRAIALPPGDINFDYYRAVCAIICWFIVANCQKPVPFLFSQPFNWHHIRATVGRTLLICSSIGRDLWIDLSRIIHWTNKMSINQLGIGL